MRVIHIDSPLSIENEAMVGLINRVNQQSESVILFLDSSYSIEELSRFQNALQKTVDHVVQVAPSKSIHVCITRDVARQKGIELQLDSFWEEISNRKEGQLILLQQASYTYAIQVNNRPSYQLLTALLAKQLQALYQLYSQDFETFLDAPFYGDVSFDTLRSYTALTESKIAKDLIKELVTNQESFELYSLIRKGHRIVVKAKDTPKENEPLIVKIMDEYYQISIHHYQLHRTPERVSQIFQKLDANHLLTRIHSTSVDGLVLSIQKTKESSQIIKKVLGELKQEFSLEKVHLSKAETFVSLAFVKEINPVEWTATIAILLHENQIKAEIMGSIYSKQSITCSIETSQVQRFKQLLEQELFNREKFIENKKSQIA